MNTVLLPVAIAGVVFAVIALLALMVMPSKEKQQQKQLAKTVNVYAGIQSPTAKPVGALLGKLRTRSETRTADLLAKRGWTDKLAAGLAAAGMTMKPEEFVLLCVATGGAGGLVMFLLAHASIPAAVLGAVVGAVIPLLFLRFKASRREASFITEMPEMLTALASGIAAGASLGQALEGVASESTGAMGDELNRAIIETRLGTSIPDALEGTAERMHCRDLGLVVMAMRLQGMHGGNLSELLNTVSATLRERVQMQRHVKALSAEGRMSLMVLMALPIMVLFFLAVVRPEYFNFFISTVMGMIMLSVVGLMMLCGYLWARTIVKVEV